MKKIIYVIVIFCSLTLMIACSARDPLVGTFSEKPDGQPLFRITKDSDVYMMEEYRENDASYKNPVAIGLCSEEELIFVYGKNWKEFDPIGICKESFGFLYSRATKKVPKLTNNGYIGIALAPFEVYRISD